MILAPELINFQAGCGGTAVPYQHTYKHIMPSKHDNFLKTWAFVAALPVWIAALPVPFLLGGHRHASLYSFQSFLARNVVHKGMSGCIVSFLLGAQKYLAVFTLQALIAALRVPCSASSHTSEGHKCMDLCCTSVLLFLQATAHPQQPCLLS
eukprot:scaffold310586_cov13-Tisochrysis_lutea.AAC.1